MPADKDEKLLCRRFKELAALCYERDIPVNTDFLSLSEQTVFQSICGTLPPVRYKLTGGFLASERKLVQFLPSYMEETDDPPFDCLRIGPSSPKFAEELTHRDYLGAIMSLGIERSVMGDLTLKDGAAYVFVLKKMSRYLTENLAQVRHTPVSVSIIESAEDVAEPDCEPIRGSVSSMRLDAVTALAARLSRTKACELIAAEKVLVNGRPELSVSRILKEGEILTVRGAGKFRIGESGGQTKKGRTTVTVYRYK